MLKMRIASYNPLSMQKENRLDDIALETTNVVTFALIGTQRGQAHGAFSKSTICNILFLHAGYMREASEANRRCGCGLLLGIINV